MGDTIANLFCNAKRLQRVYNVYIKINKIYLAIFKNLKKSSKKTLAIFEDLYYNTNQVQQVNKLTTVMKRKLRGNLLDKTSEDF